MSLTAYTIQFLMYAISFTFCILFLMSIEYDP